MFVSVTKQLKRAMSAVKSVLAVAGTAAAAPTLKSYLQAGERDEEFRRLAGEIAVSLPRVAVGVNRGVGHNLLLEVLGEVGKAITSSGRQIGDGAVWPTS